MAPEEFKRKLTAILSADVEGYSRLMGEDEDATIRTLTTYRELMSQLIQKHRGRVVDSPGDNLLSEFGSVVDGVRCAVEIQEELRVRNAELPEDRKMVFRIGINLGDVVEEGERIYGDGVNIAARVEGLADGGGICISGAVYDSIKNKLTLSYESLGEHNVKNIKEPVRVYRMRVGPEAAAKEKVGPKRWRRAVLAGIAALIIVIGAVVIWNFYLRRPSVEPASVDKMAFPLPDKPSIAVLPFDNLSGDPEQDYIGDGLSENIISALSISSKLFVIARNSTFTYKGKPVKVQQVAEDLGVQYVLEGSVQKSGERLRVTAQLIDALTGHHLWSDVYNREVKDLFDMQDEITKKIVVSLQVELTMGEDARVYAKSTDNLEAWKHYIKGSNELVKYASADFIKGHEHFNAALRLDPEYVSAWVGSAVTHWMEGFFQKSDSPPLSFKRAYELLQKALELDEKNPHAHAILGTFYLLTKKEHEKAIGEGKRAIELNPNYAQGHAWLAMSMQFSGRFNEAINLMKKAFRLNPKIQPIHLRQLVLSYIFLERYDEALELINKMHEYASKGDLPPFFPQLDYSFVYQELGRQEEARDHMAEVLKIVPPSSIEYIKPLNPYKNPANLQRMLDSYRKAGMPERPPLPLPDKPSIAVLPLKNISDDPKQEYFVDGMTETLITDLSKISELFVIASTSMFTYKGKSVKVEQIGRDLGVRYVLEGSVQRSDNQLRINAQLIDAKTGGHLWAERYDGKMDNIFSLQDQITQKIVSALAVKLTASEQEQVERKYTNNIEAYDNFLKGVGHAVRYTRNDKRQAIRYLKKAIELDPNYGPPYARLGLLHMDTPGRWTRELPWPSNLIVPRHYLQAAMKSPDPVTYRLAASLNLRLRRYKEAISEAEHALALAPNDPESHAAIALILNYAGRQKEVIKSAELQMRQDPRQVHAALFRLGSAHFSMGNLEQAVTYLERSITHNPEFIKVYPFLAATYAHLGREEEAKQALNNLSSHYGGWKPTLRAWMHLVPLKNPEVTERLADGLIKAGMRGKPSGYYKILEENKLTGEEIRKLVFGRETRTDCTNVGVDYVNRTEDGKFMHVGYGPGKSRIVDDMLCDKWDSRFKGLEYCGTVFHNPEGSSDTDDEYIYVTDFQFCKLSPMEGKFSGSYKILEENRLSGEEIRKLLFGRTMTGFHPVSMLQRWGKTSEDGTKIKQWNSRGISDSGKGWLEGDLRCHQFKKFYRGTENCFHIYRNPNGTPEKKDEYLFVGRDLFTTWSPIK